MTSNARERLSQLGFQLVGEWTLRHEKLVIPSGHDLLQAQGGVLYAFLDEDTLLYIGKSKNHLAMRLQRYRTPGKSLGSTNTELELAIRRRLLQGRRIFILAFQRTDTALYPGYVLDHAAGLEDSLIKQFSPPLNGKQRRGG
ncbi:hypothetical protein DAERI_190061 [Deinococcus aerius]|uniref:GIY-YIG domain-containing protein n=1 Tax=Deinococcus aerius TaxID=200253 RepID=A0A2I9DMX2_9DEIO|nr:hypothetical protein [Deinococcus aerius]GBF07928.1 hypothetical protein DAERI_190061 [Deinococcus aerius]